MKTTGVRGAGFGVLRRNGNGKAVAVEAEEAPTLKLVADYSQLSIEDQVALADTCGDVRDNVRGLHNQAIALNRAIERPSHMLNKAKIEQLIRAAEYHVSLVKVALVKLPYACVMLALLCLAGCCHCGDLGSGVEGQGKDGTAACAGGSCTTGKYVPAPRK